MLLRLQLPFTGEGPIGHFDRIELVPVDTEVCHPISTAPAPCTAQDSSTPGMLHMHADMSTEPTASPPAAIPRVLCAWCRVDPVPEASVGGCCCEGSSSGCLPPLRCAGLRGVEKRDWCVPDDPTCAASPWVFRRPLTCLARVRQALRPTRSNEARQASLAGVSCPLPPPARPLPHALYAPACQAHACRPESLPPLRNPPPTSAPTEPLGCARRSSGAACARGGARGADTEALPLHTHWIPSDQRAINGPCLLPPPVVSLRAD